MGTISDCLHLKVNLKRNLKLLIVLFEYSMHIVNLVSFPIYLRLISLKSLSCQANGMNGIYVI
jgi:hypothetical protein